MSERVTMPALGESVTEGTVTRWLKSVGEEVAADEPLLEVSTDKVDTEVPSPVAGTLQKILVDEDETAEVGADLCIIGDGPADDDDDSGDDSAKDEEPQEEASADDSSDEPQEKPKKSSGGGGVSGGEKVQMPALGESVTEGTVTRWLKEEGDDVEVDEPLLEVSTDKVDTEVPSPVAGKLTKILVAEDETAEVGADLCIIGGEASDDGDDDEPEAESTPEPKKEEPKPAAKEQPAKDDSAKDDSGKDDASAYVTPLVRKLAADHGVDLGSLKGTGVGGRIRKQDVLDAAKAKEEPEPEQQAAPAPSDSAPAPVAAAPAPSGGPAKATKVPEPDTTKRGTTEKLSRLRKIVAQRMVESLQTSAQLTAVVEVDMSRVAALRARNKNEFKAREGANLSFLPFICLATVEALKAFPALNSSIDGESVVYHGAEHLAIAVDTPRGLVVPVIKDAGDLNIAGLARKIADVAARTRSNKIGPDELSGGTFTISNIGSAGTVSDTPIINQPQVGILGTGTIVKRPVVVTDADGNEAIGIRSMMNLCLTYDHRIVDGADAGRFLSALKSRLEEGAFEL
ncbi:2-oxoglutarate dehydrogenase E2 component (dihydrolipoamide succinyltransferase) [Kineosphaera limosa]|uniref:2-oxoglutarate dehydrogenase, E2 component, dihydrolipoamide succinyltransferase n=1 Tax=Kineosphaera limosa TaxID=111564 RepID=UPI00058FD57E|nr:2-oxoglutarate dehydrogenase, E2 component, dihydrolipoamide succinyltransferase [Kineosphaera limosa]NYE03037.1 2-oxoglutarate dehydrogenase E2 component (dihydrolipoamide succinyltransferase) [Kineosphaera limosa]